MGNFGYVVTVAPNRALVADADASPGPWNHLPHVRAGTGGRTDPSSYATNLEVTSSALTVSTSTTRTMLSG